MTIQIRKAEIKDASGIANVGIKTWQTTYRGLFPNEELDKMSMNENTEKWERVITNNSKNKNLEMIVAEDSQAGIVGYAGGGKYDTTPPFDCELGAIYVLEEYQGRTIGTKLIRRMLEFFHLNNWKTMIIWILKGNPYCRFYEKLGGIPQEKMMYEKWGTKHELIGYIWEDINRIKLEE